MNIQIPNERKSIGVVIPTRNSAAFLPRHLEQLQFWIDLAEEVVVVDSESTDSTLSILEAELTHERVRFLQHPPGLYPSWNFAVQHLSASWTYISTVGDTIERNHLIHLAESAHDLQCDVLCSAPRFTHLESAQEDVGNPPARVMCNELRPAGPVPLSSRLTLAYASRFALVHGLNTPLGSSASNIYRTASLKKFPFPSNYGSAGDAFWLLENAGNVRYALSPACGSTYLVHPSQHSPSDHDYKLDLNQRAAEIVMECLEQLTSSSPPSAKLDGLIKAICSVGAKLGLAQHKLDSLKQSRMGKICALGPCGWLPRWKRNNLRNELKALEASLVRQIAIEERTHLQPFG